MGASVQTETRRAIARPRACEGWRAEVVTRVSPSLSQFCAFSSFLRWRRVSCVQVGRPPRALKGTRSEASPSNRRLKTILNELTHGVSSGHHWPLHGRQLLLANMISR